MRRKQQINLLVSTLLVGLAITAVVAALFLPLNAASDSSRTRVASSQSSSARFGHTARPKLEAFNGLTSRSLQGPLFDPPPIAEPEPESEPELPPPPPPEVQLVATMLEETGISHALFAQSDGTVLVRSVGQTISENGGEVTVCQITERSVQLSHEGNEFTLELPGEPIE